MAAAGAAARGVVAAAERRRAAPRCGHHSARSRGFALAARPRDPTQRTDGGTTTRLRSRPRDRSWCSARGQKSRIIPLRGRIVLETEAYLLEPLPLLGRTPEPDDHLPLPEKRTGGGRLLAAYPKRRMSAPTVHRWWYRHAAPAGLVGEGMTSGLNMHRARHTFATDLAVFQTSGPLRRRSVTPTFRQRPPSTATTTSPISSVQWTPSHARDVRKPKGRPTETFQSTDPLNGLLKPIMEAAGIEPAQGSLRAGRGVPSAPFSLRSARSMSGRARGHSLRRVL